MSMPRECYMTEQALKSKSPIVSKFSFKLEIGQFQSSNSFLGSLSEFVVRSSALLLMRRSLPSFQSKTSLQINGTYQAFRSVGGPPWSLSEAIAIEHQINCQDHQFEKQFSFGSCSREDQVGRALMSGAADGLTVADLASWAACHGFKLRCLEMKTTYRQKQFILLWRRQPKQCSRPETSGVRTIKYEYVSYSMYDICLNNRGSLTLTFNNCSTITMRTAHKIFLCYIRETSGLYTSLVVRRFYGSFVHLSQLGP